MNKYDLNNDQTNRILNLANKIPFLDILPEVVQSVLDTEWYVF
jgi:hypothetical protein